MKYVAYFAAGFVHFALLLDSKTYQNLFTISCLEQTILQ